MVSGEVLRNEGFVGETNVGGVRYRYASKMSICNMCMFVCVSLRVRCAWICRCGVCGVCGVVKWWCGCAIGELKIYEAKGCL